MEEDISLQQSFEQTSFPPSENLESSQAQKAHQENVIQPPKLSPDDEWKRCRSCKNKRQYKYSKRYPSQVAGVQCKNEKCDKYQPPVGDANNNRTEVGDRVEHLIEGKPHYGEVIKILATGESPAAEVKFEGPYPMEMELKYRFGCVLPMKTLTNVGYPPNARYPQ